MATDKLITLDELKRHNEKDSFYILLHGKVYDATQFLDEHPGGDEVILAEAGKDATEAFEDVGHSDEARAILDKLQIGILDPGSTGAGAGAAAPPKPTPSVPTSSPTPSSGSSIAYLAPLAVLGAYLGWRFYYA